MASISSHLRNEENKASTSERNGKKGQTISKSEANKKDKDPTDMESMQQMIKQLMNEIIDMKKNRSEGKNLLIHYLIRKLTFALPLRSLQFRA